MGGVTVAERLRAYVRERVRKDGRLYERGAGSRLAEAIHKPTSWVTEYTDMQPTRHADIDTAISICAVFGVRLADFEQDAAPAARERPPTTLNKTERRALRLLGLTSDAGQRRAIGLLAEVARAFPRPPSQESTAQSDQRHEETRRRVRGRR